MDNITIKPSEALRKRNFDGILTEKFEYNISSSWNNSDDLIMDKIDMLQKDEEEEEEEEEEYYQYFILLYSHSIRVNKKKFSINKLFCYLKIIMKSKREELRI